MKQTAALLRLITHLASLDAEMPISRLQIFLIVSRRKQMLVRDLTKVTGMNQSTIARSLAALGDKPTRYAKQGLNLVEYQPDPEDPRRMLVQLTSKGVALVADIETMME